MWLLWFQSGVCLWPHFQNTPVDKEFSLIFYTCVKPRGGAQTCPRSYHYLWQNLDPNSGLQPAWQAPLLLLTCLHRRLLLEWSLRARSRDGYVVVASAAPSTFPMSMGVCTKLYRITALETGGGKDEFSHPGPPMLGL